MDVRKKVYPHTPTQTLSHAESPTRNGGPNVEGNEKE